jgi:hypothetical protein
VRSNSVTTKISCASKLPPSSRRAIRIRPTAEPAASIPSSTIRISVGGQFSFWNRQGIRLTQTGVALVEPNSLLPSLRSSKTQGQANFVNPGIFIFNAGADVEVTQRIRAIFNANFLRFHRTEPLEQVLFQNRIRHGIGQDYSLGVSYRPLLINNIIMNFGASTFVPGRGFRDIYTDRTRNCPPNVADYCTPDNTVIDPSKPLFSLFAQLRFIF